MTEARISPAGPVSTGGMLTIILCVLTAMNEGLDIQAAGIAAPRMAREFGLEPSQLGYMLTAGPLGLMIGAALGGRLADHLGRKTMLIGSMLLFGLCSLGTAWASTHAMVVVMRGLTGVGLGGAVPNLVALAAEAAPSHRRNTIVSITTAGLPLGGVVAGLIGAMFPADSDWRMVFYIGGVAPLLLAVMLLWKMPESNRFREARIDGMRPTGILVTLFGGGRLPATVLLGSAFFCAFLLLYLLLSWLPALMVGKGFSSAESGWLQAAFNLGGAAGGVILGTLMDRSWRRLVMLLGWIGIAGALVALAAIPSALPWACLISLVAGLFVTGTQLTLYGLTSGCYETVHRGTGIGFAVAFGRIGSVVGPWVGAVLIGNGGESGKVLTSILPVVLVGGLAAVAVTWLGNLRAEAAPSRNKTAESGAPAAMPRPE